ncbi:hypothetical protein [Streptomyces sp. NBC_01233]|nr:hypothetical protein OG332_43110 [Streptomyces sp. NBC_01233]
MPRWHTVALYSRWVPKGGLLPASTARESRQPSNALFQKAA